jgi:hypothetical protein
VDLSLRAYRRPPACVSGGCRSPPPATSPPANTVSPVAHRRPVSGPSSRRPKRPRRPRAPTSAPNSRRSRAVVAAIRPPSPWPTRSLPPLGTSSTVARCTAIPETTSSATLSIRPARRSGSSVGSKLSATKSHCDPSPPDPESSPALLRVWPGASPSLTDRGISSQP